ncbi:MAG TPA: hypothetical protein VEM96_15075 [Pyrinomonadaceae bacterium]|nr:hypothetical protein [Pyrinomonadaceae bacterium]
MPEPFQRLAKPLKWLFSQLKVISTSLKRGANEMTFHVKKNLEPDD